MSYFASDAEAIELLGYSPRPMHEVLGYTPLPETSVYDEIGEMIRASRPAITVAPARKGSAQ